MQLSRNTLSRVCGGLVLLGAMALFGGCEVNDFLAPNEPKIIGADTYPNKADAPPLVVPIVDTIAPGVEEPDSAYSQATDIRPDDLIPIAEDYTVGINDVLSVGIQDLQGEGTGEVVKQVRVTETGNISLPYLPAPVHAEGLTERQIQDAVVAAYENAKMIQHAQVTVTVDVARQRTFKIIENAGQPAEYQIDKPDYRMMDALVVSRAPASPIGVPYAYVIRKPPAPKPATVPMPEENGVMPATMPATNPGDLLTPPTGRAHPNAATPVLADTAPGSSTPGVSGQFQFNDLQAPDQTRVIRVPIFDLLQNGEFKYNIVIRPGDLIVVPQPQQGVYYMGGHIARAGVYSLTGFKVTIKQAWVAAGGADTDAIPRRTEVIRRVGDNKEVFVRLNMSKVWAGLQPDVLLKPDDMVVVGTDAMVPFITIIRNAIPSLSTSIGLSYQRNFYTGVNPL